MKVTQGLKAIRELGDQPCLACVCTNICDSRQLLRYGHDRQAGHWPVELKGDAMMQSEIESELRALRTDLDEIVNGTQSQENEWRRLGRISSVCAVLAGLVGAGFLIANAMIERTSTNQNFHDQLVMMGITFFILNIPLMLLGMALRKRSQPKFELKR
jgi:hypothetical protein